MDKKIEHYFICDLIRGNISSSPYPADNDDWMSVYHAAVRHNLAPYVYYLLKQDSVEYNIPNSIMDSFRDQYYLVATKNTRIYHELKKIVKSLNSNNIPCILLKGVYLAQDLYDKPALRSMNDIDLLLKQEDIATAVRILADIDFHPSQPFFIDALEEFQIHIPALIKSATDQSKQVAVELHWSIARSTLKHKIDRNQLWLNSSTIDIDELNASVMSVEKNLHHIALHASYDDLFGNGIRPLVDILLITRKKDINWNKLLRICKDSGTDRYIFITFSLTKKLLGATIPESFMKEVEPDVLTDEMLQTAEEILFRDSMRGYSEATFIGRTLKGSFWNQVKSLLKKLYPPRSELSETYGIDPASLKMLLYYPIRWKDIFIRYIAVLCKIIKGDDAMKKSLHLGRKAGKLAEWMEK